MATVTKIPANIQPAAGTVQWLNDCVERGKATLGYSEVTTLTPGLAAELLRRNESNRVVTAGIVAKIASDIRGGRWQLNLEPIIISETGEMNDGQHRCLAVIDANTPVPVSFTFGASRESRLTVDQGGARGAAHFLQMQDIPNASTAAGIARLVLIYEYNDGQNVSSRAPVTNTEVTIRARTDPGIAEAATFAHRQARSMKAYCAPSALGACYYLLAREHPKDAAAYMEQVCSGENLKRRDPAYAVRDRLATSGKSPNQKMEIIFRGWNAFRAGRELKLAKVLGNFPALI